MQDKQTARPGSARAKLESFDRVNKGKESMMKKLLIIFALLILAIVVQVVISKSTSSNDFFEIPKDASWMIREGKWDKLREVLRDDLKIEGTSLKSADDFISLLKSYGKNGVSAFATVPHTWVSVKDEARIQFWVIWSRGDISERRTIPLTRSWLVDCGLKYDGKWQVADVKVKASMMDGETTVPLNLEDLKGK